MADQDEEIAAAILAARHERRCLPARTGDLAIAPDRAYRIQSFVTQARLGRGERLAGWKLGYTSAAMREQMGIAEPNLGPLTDVMLLRDGDQVPDTVIQPKVEPEIALVMGADVTVSCAAEDIRPYVRTAQASLEIVDSIWCDYRFTWADNTADGSSAAFVVVGDALSTQDLAAVDVTLLRNGEPVGTGKGEAAMGDPFAALAWLADRLLSRGQRLRAGDTIITGGLCAAVDLEPGDVVAASFGGVEVAVSRGSR